MGPGRDGSKWQQVKNESGGPRDIAANAGERERLPVWDAGSYVGWFLLA